MVLDLNAEIVDTIKMLNRLISEDIQLTMTLGPEIGFVNIDPGQLRQIIMNLAMNGRDAMPQGGRLTIETSNILLDSKHVNHHIDILPGSYVQLSVSDTGTGLSAETKQHLFEPFYTTKEVGHGTGLGLATVYGIIKQSCGNIEVYSEEGIGTTFKIYLPQFRGKIEPVKSQSKLLKLLRGKETILLVEDEEMVRNLTTEILELSGYTVISVQNGIEALKICDSGDNKFDLLMTDVVMPQMGGRELSEKLSARFPNLSILLTSGYTDDAVVRHGVIESTSNFIQKPFSPDSLTIKIREILDKAGEDRKSVL